MFAVFGGRLAPRRAKALISGPAYSHELWSAGFWAGWHGHRGIQLIIATLCRRRRPDKAVDTARGGRLECAVGRILLMYDDVRRAESPEDALYQFLGSIWEAAATLE